MRLSAYLSTAENTGGFNNTYLSMDEVGKLGWIPQEENRSIVGDHIPVTLIGPELNRETTRITGAIVRTRLAADGGESDSDGASLPLLKDIG
jgi:hypothetical protein